jgi:pyruvate dehydrogenase E1 component beta subunit
MTKAVRNEAPAGGQEAREMTFAEAIAETLREAMRRDPTIYVMGEDVGLHGGVFRCTAGLYEEFGPQRVRDTPISESAIVGAGLGSALTGMRPIVEIQYSDFLPEAMDQMVNQVAKARYMSGGQVQVPLVVRAPGGRSKSAASQHSQSLETWFAHVPGLIVVLPSTPADAKGLLHSAIASPDPVLFLEHKLLYRTKGRVPQGDYTVPIGRADVKRRGRDLTIVAASWMTLKSLEAAEQLAAEGIDVEIIDIRTLMPLDEGTILDSVARTGRLLLVHEAPKRYGWGGDIVSTVVEKRFHSLKAPPRRVGAKHAPVPMAPVLEDEVLPGPADIVQAARSVMAS